MNCVKNQINFYLFIHYQQRFRQTDFFSTFVRNLNFNNLIGLIIELDQQSIPAQQQALAVV